MFEPPSTVRAFFVRQDAGGKPSAKVEDIPFGLLPPGDVTLRVAYSSLNFKDALAASAHPGVVKTLPHVPGIDVAGTVVVDSSGKFESGSEVLVTGYELGAGQWGGYCDYVRVPADWVVPVPAGLSLRDCMAYGTAGFTAVQCVAALVKHRITPDRGEIVVTGAGGGVGSIAVGILSKLKYQVIAVSGKPSAKPLLTTLGAKAVVDRAAVNDRQTRPILPARWSGAVDTVGGNILGTILRSTQPDGCVTACGLVAGTDVPMTVYPFILRGITLCGIDSAFAKMEQRLELWQKLASTWRPAALESLVTEITLNDLPRYISEILAGQTTGRVVVRL